MFYTRNSVWFADHNYYVSVLITTQPLDEIAMSLKETSLDILHYLLRFLKPEDLCKLNQLSHLWRSLTEQEVIWKPLTIDRWDTNLKQYQIGVENNLNREKKESEASNATTWKDIYKKKYLQYQKYAKLLDQVNANLFERIRTSYSMEVGEYIWEKIDTVNSIRSKPVHNSSNPQSPNSKADPSPVEIWKGVPATEYYNRQTYTHFTVYLTKLLFGVPYADVIKIIEEVEERHQWDQQMLQGWTLKRLDRHTDIVHMLFEGMELLLLRQRHERTRPDGRRVSVFGQITPNEDELEDDVKQAIHDNIRTYFDDEEDIDGLLRIKEQLGSGWCVEEVDAAQNTIRLTNEFVQLSYQVRFPPEKAWETNLLFMAQATARAACLPRLEEYYHSKYGKRKLSQSTDNTK